MTATAAVGCPIDTVNASSAVRLSAPNACAAAICSTIACTEILTAGTAMRLRAGEPVRGATKMRSFLNEVILLSCVGALFMGIVLTAANFVG